MQLTFSATTSAPSGLVPWRRPRPRNRCRLVLDRVLVEEIFAQIVLAGAEPKLFGSRKAKCRPFLVQIEQLQAVTMARSVVHSNRTMPQ